MQNIHDEQNKNKNRFQPWFPHPLTCLAVFKIVTSHLLWIFSSLICIFLNCIKIVILLPQFKNWKEIIYLYCCFFFGGALPPPPKCCVPGQCLSCLPLLHSGVTAASAHSISVLAPRGRCYPAHAPRRHLRGWDCDSVYDLSQPGFLLCKVGVITLGVWGWQRHGKPLGSAPINTE